VSKAPPVDERARALASFSKNEEVETMVSIEPIFDFDVQPFFEMIRDINPNFVSIGADSKGSGVPEPTKEKVESLVKLLEDKTKIKLKKNLNRILK